MEAFITHRSRLDFPDHADGTPQDMPVPVFAKVTELLSQGSRSACIIRGNEPTLHPQFEGILEAADKRALPVVVETCGLMPPESKRLLRERDVPLLWRLYHPRFYPEEDRAELEKTLDQWAEQSPESVRLLVVISDTADTPQFAVDILERFPIRRVIFRVLCNNDLDGMRKMTTFLTPHVIEMTTGGGEAAFDCGLPVCSYTDSDFGRLAKLGILRLACNPRPGVLPDGRVYHCHRMMDFPQGQLGMFKRLGEVGDYFYRRHNFLQWDLRHYPGCHGCPCLQTRSCGGFGLAAKAEKLAESAAHLEEVVANEENQDALVDLGRVLFELCRYADAEHCLLEARRVDPANADVHLFLARTYWEMGQAADSDEEYHKAARLVPDGRPVLLELLKHYQQQGSAFKARRLTEEIKRMADQPGG